MMAGREGGRDGRKGERERKASGTFFITLAFTDPFYKYSTFSNPNNMTKSRNYFKNHFNYL